MIDGEVRDYVSSKSWEVLTERADELWLCICPFCGAESKNKTDLHFSISMTTGACKCFRPGCEANTDKGHGFNLWTMKKHFGDILPIDAFEQQNEVELYAERLRAARRKVSPEKVETFHQRLLGDAKLLEQLEHGPLPGFPQGRGITLETIKRFHLGLALINGQNERWLSIPTFAEGSPVLIKYRNLDAEGKENRFRREEGGLTVPFNVDALKVTQSGVCYLCEGEMDAMSAEQLGLSPVVAGTAGAGAFDPTWRRFFEPFDKIVLLYDNDLPDPKTGKRAGDEGAKKVSQELGAYRCYRAQLPTHDVNELLTTDPEAKETLAKVVRDAKPMGGTGVLHLTEAMELLFSDPRMSTPGESTGWEDLDLCIGGVRPEFVVWSGDTKVGKTTLLSALLRNLAKSGLPTLFIPPEMRREETARKQVVMELQKPFLDLTAEDKAQAFTRLKGLPFWIADAEGFISVGKVRNTVEAFVRRCKGKIVVVDHLDFLLDQNAQDERREINRVIMEMKDWPKKYDVAVHLVVHPAKLRADEKGKTRRVTMNDMRGSAAIKQLAQMILILHRVGKKNEILEIEDAGVRWDGVRKNGSVYLQFDTKTMQYLPAKKPEHHVGRRKVDPKAEAQRGNASEPAPSRYEDDEPGNEFDEVESNFRDEPGSDG